MTRTHTKIAVVPTNPAEPHWHRTDYEYLNELFFSADATDLSVKQSIRAIQDSEALLTRIEHLLSRR